MDVFLRLGDPLTASDLWDPEWVRAGANKVGSEIVFFIVPIRESMAMCADVRPLVALAQQRLEEPENEFVLGIPTFAIEDGKLGLIGQAAILGAPASAAPQTSSVNTAHSPQGVTLRSSAGRTIVLALTEPDLERAEKKMEELLRKRLDEYCSDAAFSGTILNPELIKPSDENRARLARILSRLNDEVWYLGRRTLSGGPLQVLGQIGLPRGS